MDSPWQIWSSPEATGPATGANPLHRKTSHTSLSSLSACAEKNERSTKSPGFDVDCNFDMKGNDLELSMKNLHIGDDESPESLAGPKCTQSRSGVSTPSELAQIETKYARQQSLKQNLRGIGAMHEFDDHRLSDPQKCLQQQDYSEEYVQLPHDTGSDREILDSLQGLTLKDLVPCETVLKPETLIPSATNTNLRVEINRVEEYGVDSLNSNGAEQVPQEPNNSSGDEDATPNWDLDFDIDCSESFDFWLVDPLLRDENGTSQPPEPEPLELATPDMVAIGDDNALPIQSSWAPAELRVVRNAQSASLWIPATPDSW